MLNKTFYILIFVCLNLSYSQSQDNYNILDSIELYKQYSKNSDKYNNDQRLNFAKKAQELSVDLGVDSIIVHSNRRLSSVYWELKYYSSFEKINRKNKFLSHKIGDSVSLAKANYKLGDFYKYYKFETDSAYYYYNQAEKIYRSINANNDLAFTLYEIAIIRKNEKDFTGSELTSIEAISIIEEIKPTYSITELESKLYNNLGLVFSQLELYEESIKYYQKSLDIKKKLNGKNTIIIDNTINNLALVYKNLGKYKLAIKFYNDLLENKNILKLRPDFYALVLDNYAHTLYLSDKKEKLPNLYKKALKVSDSVDYQGYNSIIINQHLAEYYHDINKSDSAKYYGYRAKDISEQYHNDDLLKSLLLLSEIEEDSMASKHLKTYVKLSDSLQKNERSIRNKFARIRFETQQIEQENIEMTKQRLWLLIISVVIIIASFLLYLVITQRNKNRELQFIQKQQQTNEEIYNLMLSQNENVEEARALEKKRISEELHDGVLGRLFGTRLSLDSLNMSNSPEAIKTRSQYISELKTIEEDIRKVSHELNTDFVSGSGFIDIIKTLVETQTLAYKLDYKMDHDDAIHWDDISNKKKIHIYRIIQESLHNIYKHAIATEVNISFTLEKNVICLTISDNGSGYDVSKAKSGIGLKNMNSRIKEINGTIEITSEKEVGTTVTIKAPLH